MNLATFIVLTIIVVLLFMIVKNGIKKRKSGKLNCGGDCTNCGKCH